MVNVWRRTSVVRTEGLHNSAIAFIGSAKAALEVDAGAVDSLGRQHWCGHGAHGDKVVGREASP